MWIFEKVFLYFSTIGQSPEHLEFVTDVKLEFIANNQIESSLKEEFAGITSPPRAVRLSFTRLLAHQPNPKDKETAKLSTNIADTNVLAIKNDPPPPAALHNAFHNKTKCLIGVYLGDGSKCLSQGWIVSANYEQSVGSHLRCSYEFVGNADEWKPPEGGKKI